MACKNSAPTDNSKIEEEIKNLRIPLYPTANNIKENYYRKYTIKNVKYDVDMHYPADKIVAFYDEEMNKISFTPFVEDYYQDYDRVWQTYIDGTMKGEPDVASLTTSWVDKDRTKRATIVLRYYWYGKKQNEIYFNNNRMLKVTFRIKPFAMEPPPTKQVDIRVLRVE